MIPQSQLLKEMKEKEEVFKGSICKAENNCSRICKSKERANDASHENSITWLFSSRVGREGKIFV